MYNKVFLLIRDEDVFQNKSGLVAGPATLGNSYNLHKSKMASKWLLEKLTFSIIVTECCIKCHFICFFGMRIPILHVVLHSGVPG